KKTDSSLLCYNEVIQFSLKLEKPRAITIGQNDNLYVAGNGKVLIYNNQGALLETINTGKQATAIAINPQLGIILAMEDHIEIWNSEAKKTAQWEGVNERSVVTSIAIHDQSIFVADAGNKIVYHYDFKGELKNTIGEKDTLQGIPGFVIPSPYFDLLIGRDDELWVVNPGRHQFEAYSFDGRLKSSWKRTSMQVDGFSGCCNPSNIALLSDGSFVTSEKGIERVKIHSPSGDFNCLVAGSEAFAEGTVGIDLAVDSQDRIFILDPHWGEIKVFKKN
ncbi:MAG: hypothetical protein JEZ03_09990, partial [Bacteroidales bacterium]|nr:hypothetical protein [Bacteroidales bacterium]